MDDTQGGVYLLTFLCAVVGLICAVVAEPRRVRREPNTKPYKWALFQAYSALTLSSLILMGGVVVLLGGEVEDGLAMLFIGACLFAPAFFVLRRRRWAWVTLTILSFNPVNWIIGYIYGSNRWQEFRAAEIRTGQKAGAESVASDGSTERLRKLRDSGALSEEEYQELSGRNRAEQG